MRSGILGGVGALFLLCAASVNATVTLQAGDVSVSFDRGGSWTVSSIDWKSHRFCDGLAIGSAQGTVIEFGDGVDRLLAGSYHGGETLVGATVTVDGVSGAIQDDTSYSGDVVQLSRSSVILDAFALTSTMTISSAGITERVVLTGLATNLSVFKCYGFLASRENRLNKVATFDQNGGLLSVFSTRLDNFTEFRFDAASVAQYDPVAGEGILSTLSEGLGYGAKQSIQDRGTDNKLYVTLYGLGGPVVAGAQYAMTQEITFFQTPASQWYDPEPPVDPPPWEPPPPPPDGILYGDFNMDGEVGPEDFGILKDGFGLDGLVHGQHESWTLGDANDDGEIGPEDFGLLKDDFGMAGGGTGTVSLSSVPEPATLLALFGGPMLVGLKRRPKARVR
ncbi:MAG: PEP-CTERM sorting domain-containing protein [Planctomycetota bacterium]|nr:PEP-CTERM sorting domain-containing protein [Planctomycetota bacterium]